MKAQVVGELGVEGGGQDGALAAEHGVAVDGDQHLAVVAAPLDHRRPEEDRRKGALVEATAHFKDAAIVAKVSRGLGEAMRGAEIQGLETRLAERGW